MLISILLSLVSEHDVTLPAFVGRANHAMTLARLAEFDPALAKQLHDGDGPKPITCSGVLNTKSGPGGVTIHSGQPILVRVTGLTATLGAALRTALIEQPPQQWELDRQRFAVQEVICDAARHPWSGSSSYEALAATQLLRSEQIERSATFEFASPTAFHSNGVTMPVPLPELVFGSLVDRWNAFSPITLSPEMRRFGEEMMAISRYRLESRAVGQKQTALRIGGVGHVTYHALGGDRYWLGVMQMLTDFALYSGVGVQTATGMGQTRRREGGRGERQTVKSEE